MRTQHGWKLRQYKKPEILCLHPKKPWSLLIKKFSLYNCPQYNTIFIRNKFYMYIHDARFWKKSIIFFFDTSEIWKMSQIWKIWSAEKTNFWEKNILNEKITKFFNSLSIITSSCFHLFRTQHFLIEDNLFKIKNIF